jgi:hypothetical protein
MFSGLPSVQLCLPISGGERVPNPLSSFFPTFLEGKESFKGKFSPWLIQSVFFYYAEFPICQEYQSQSGTLKEVWFQLQTFNNHLRTQDQMDQQEVEWLELLYRFDQLLFRSYLAILGLYAITLCSLWALWSGL